MIANTVWVVITQALVCFYIKYGTTKTVPESVLCRAPQFTQELAVSTTRHQLLHHSGKCCVHCHYGGCILLLNLVFCFLTDRPYFWKKKIMLLLRSKVTFNCLLGICSNLFFPEKRLSFFFFFFFFI